MLSFLYNELLYRPILNALAILYDYLTFHSLGLSIIILTIVIRLILIPVFYKTARHQKLMQSLQPRLKRIQEEHKDNKVKKAEATMALYKEHGVNPLSSTLLPFVQLLFLIPLYGVFKNGFSADALNSLYSFVAHPEAVQNSFLGIDLTAPNAIIVVLSAAGQYIQGKLSMSLVSMEKKKELDASDAMVRNMVYIGPLMTLMILWKFQAAIGLYWLTGTIFMTVQQYIVNKHIASEMSLVKSVGNDKNVKVS